jgi:hypothetical protein
MATGRTVSASFLTDLDKQVIKLCEKIAETIYNAIKDKDLQKDFKKQFGKISYTRDGGLGLGGGKLQRDAICVRGRQGKAPFSNRNLRWHPLIVAANPVSFAKEIEKIEIEGTDESQVLVFYIKENGKLKAYPTWQPEWRPSKKGEREDASVQVMHVNPLIDKEIRHNAKNVRYGHRWCNVAMTDHSLDETLDFMEFIVKAHKRV